MKFSTRLMFDEADAAKALESEVLAKVILHIFSFYLLDMMFYDWWRRSFICRC